MCMCATAVVVILVAPQKVALSTLLSLQCARIAKIRIQLVNPSAKMFPASESWSPFLIASVPFVRLGRVFRSRSFPFAGSVCLDARFSWFAGNFLFQYRRISITAYHNKKSIVLCRLLRRPSQ